MKYFRVGNAPIRKTQRVMRQNHQLLSLFKDITAKVMSTSTVLPREREVETLPSIYVDKYITPVECMPDYTEQAAKYAVGMPQNFAFVSLHYLSNPYVYYRFGKHDYQLISNEMHSLKVYTPKSCDGFYIEVEVHEDCPPPELCISARPYGTEYYAGRIQYQKYSIDTVNHKKRWFFEGCFPMSLSPYNESLDIIVRNTTSVFQTCSVHVGAVTLRNNERSEGKFPKIISNQQYTLKSEDGVTRVVRV